MYGADVVLAALEAAGVENARIELVHATINYQGVLDPKVYEVRHVRVLGFFCLKTKAAPPLQPAHSLHCRYWLQETLIEACQALRVGHTISSLRQDR